MKKLNLIKFHGSLSAEDQRLAILRANSVKQGFINVILATPIADSSVTLHNLSMVLDSGLIKLLEIDSRTKLEILRKFWPTTTHRLKGWGTLGVQGTVFKSSSRLNTPPTMGPAVASTKLVVF